MALATVTDVVSRVQTLVDDPAGRWADYNYVKGFLLQANDDLNTELASYNLTINEQQAVLPAIPANTADLSAYMTTGQPLENMELPTTLEWRNSGETDEQWKPIRRVDKVIDSTTSDFPRSWGLRNQVPYLSPSTVSIDIRVCYDQITLPPSDQDSEIIRGSLNVLAYETAELIAGIRGGLSGSGEPLAKYLNVKAEDAKEDFTCLMVKRSQSIRRRFGKANEDTTRGSLSIPFVS